MNEPMKNNEPVKIENASSIGETARYRWAVNWVVLLSTVFLFASSLNCLFLWLSYGRNYDAAGLLFSLILAVMVYHMALNPNRMASLQRRLLFAVTSMMAWAVLMPVIMRLAGFN